MNKSVSTADAVRREPPVRVVFFGSIGVAAKILEERFLLTFDQPAMLTEWGGTR